MIFVYIDDCLKEYRKVIVKNQKEFIREYVKLLDMNN